MSTAAGVPVRVLAYTDSRIFSGAENAFCDLVEGLSARAGIRLSSAAPRENRELSERLSAAVGAEPFAVPAQPLRAAALHLYDPRRRAAASRLLRNRDWDVLLVNLPSAEYGATPLLCAGLERTSCVGLLHVPAAFTENEFRLGRMREILARRAIARLDVVCVLSESARDSFERNWNGHGTLVRAVQLPVPAMQRRQRAASRRKLGLPEGPIVGIAGRISFKQKGHEAFVEAARILAERNPAVSFAVAGDGRDGERLERMLEELGLSERFHLLGQVEPIELFLSSLDAIAIPSRFEGMPLIALEALSLGVPGIASDADGLREVWPRRWQVPAGDPVRLAEALAELLGAPPEDHDRFREEGRRLLQRYSGDGMAEQVEAVIVEAAGG